MSKPHAAVVRSKRNKSNLYKSFNKRIDSNEPY